MSTYLETTEAEGWTRANALRLRCKAFSNYPVSTQLLHVEAHSGIVYAWDSVACHFTSLHCMNKRAQAKARKLAGWAP
jgi:hypothetical protein